MNDKRGFTLIELLVVIAIIGILSSVVLVSVNKARAKARDATRMSDINQINKAIQLYILDHDHAPDLGVPGCQLPGTYLDGTCFASQEPTPEAGNWNKLKADLAPYIKLPVDPCGKKCYEQSTATSRAKFFNYIYIAPGATNFNTRNDPTAYEIYAEDFETNTGNFGFNEMGNGFAVGQSH